MAVDLQLQHIFFRYTGIGASDRWILQDVSLRFHRNECAAIVGASGSGKTTLIQHFTGLLKPVSGRVLVDGQDIWDKKFDQNRLRQRIGLVFQFPETQLFEETVFRDVAYGPKNFGMSEAEIAAVVQAAIQQVGLQPQAVLHRSPFHLSEGEKRRVAIAGILAMKPELVVLDEPTAGLDAGGVEEMEEIVEQLVREGSAVIVVTHHMDFVNNIAHRTIVLNEGQVIFDDQTHRLFVDGDFLQRVGLALPQFLRLKAEQGHLWPPAWCKATSLRELMKEFKKSQPNSM